MYKKTVIMTSLNQTKQKAVLNLEKTGNEVSGYLRLYNFESEPRGILSLGILLADKVKKVALNKKCDMQYTFLLEMPEDLQDFTCALVNIDEANVIPILQGFSGGQKTTEQRLASALSVFDSDLKAKKIEEELDENQIELEEQDEIENQITEALKIENEKNEKCASCRYRDAFYCEKQEEILPKENLAENDTKTDLTFFDGIKEQIDSLFGKYPDEEFLNEIIPNSKWIKIDYEQNGEYYVVGLMYEDDKIKYVCYGVPGMYASEPPEELAGFSQWLPLDSTKPEGFGYWITYQDAETGENVKIEYNVV